MPDEETHSIDSEIVDFLEQNELIHPGQTVEYRALTGGVSSEIWRADTGESRFCVKRALGQLKVTAKWIAPVERNLFEVEWCRLANDVIPGCAPRILAASDEQLAFAMNYFEPDTYTLWKATLMAGRVEVNDARLVGVRLARLHGATANGAPAQNGFTRPDIFHAIRLSPYIEATAERHADVSDRLLALSDATANKRICVIHGDVSPKNILIGPDGPVFIDAECANLGDPAFDLAFCSKHLLLKCLVHPDKSDQYMHALSTLSGAYIANVDWEPRDQLEVRACALLAVLFLARVDGKSPVDYVNDEVAKNRVRRVALHFIDNPATAMDAIMEAWLDEMRRADL